MTFWHSAHFIFGWLSAKIHMWFKVYICATFAYYIIERNSDALDDVFWKVQRKILILNGALCVCSVFMEKLNCFQFNYTRTHFSGILLLIISLEYISFIHLPTLRIWLTKLFKLFYWSILPHKKRNRNTNECMTFRRFIKF